MNEIQVKHTPASIVANIAALKAELAERLSPFKGLVLDANQIAEGKKIVADLNKEKKTISSRRLEIMRAHKLSAEPFETGMKELESMYDDATKDMNAQISESEQKRKAEIAVTLNEALNKQWEALGVEPEFRTATVGDLALLGSATATGKLTAKASGEVKNRANENRALQDRTNMRLLKLENQSYHAGLHAPLARNHVETFLFETDDVYQLNLDHIIAAELDRQKATEEKLSKRNEEENKRRIDAAVSQDRTMREAEKSSAYVTQQPAPHEQPQFEQTMDVQPSTQSVTVTCIFHPEVPPAASDEQIAKALRNKLEAAGIKTLSSISITRNKNQNAA